MKMNQFVLFGAGKRCGTLCRFLKNSKYEEVLVVDNNPEKWGIRIEGYEVQSPEILLGYADIKYCITIANETAAASVRHLLCSKYGLNPENEIKYNILILDLLKNDSLLKERILSSTIMVNEKRSILFDCYAGLNLGGVESWTMDICANLLKSGNDQTYIISDNGEYSIPADLEGHILYVDINHQDRLSLSNINNIIDAILSKLPGIVVTCTTNEIMVAAYLIKNICPELIDIISVVHNSNDRVYAEYMDFKDCTDVYIAVSIDIQRELVTRGIHRDKVLHMTCPVKCDKELVREYTTNPAEPIKLGYAGRVEYSQKRMDLLIKLIDSLECRKVNYVLKIAGEGIALKDIQDFIEERKLNRKIVCLGKIDRSQIPEFWKSADVCINMADFEGRSISIMEAMANGAVPVVTATSGVREDISDGENGYIVEIGNYDDMADRIFELSMHRERLSVFGQKSHDVILSKAQMSTHIKFWNRVFNSLWH